MYSYLLYLSRKFTSYFVTMRKLIAYEMLTMCKEAKLKSS